MPRLVEKIAGKAIDETPTYKEFIQLAGTIEPPRDFASITPGA